MYSPEKAAAYNLCILLSVSGSKAMAFRVRRKYLCFEQLQQCLLNERITHFFSLSVLFLPMGLPLLVGSLLIAFGPSSIFYVTTVSRRPYLLVVSLFGYASMISRVMMQIPLEYVIICVERSNILDMEYLECRMQDSSLIRRLLHFLFPWFCRYCFLSCCDHLSTNLLTSHPKS